MQCQIPRQKSSQAMYLWNMRRVQIHHQLLSRTLPKIQDQLHQMGKEAASMQEVLLLDPQTKQGNSTTKSNLILLNLLKKFFL
jgi:hypothetical protein